MTSGGPEPSKTAYAYQSFLDSAFKDQWKRIGTHRRAGVATPLFSVYSDDSIGIGEFPDIALLAKWCRDCGMSIIQLLPMNDVGFNFRPYDADSSFALDPMYLSLENIESVPIRDFAPEIATLRRRFSKKTLCVDYSIKQEKLAILKRMFKKRQATAKRSLEAFQKDNRFWLRDYAAFRVLKDLDDQKAWWEWPCERRKPSQGLFEWLENAHKEEMDFQQWLQWQLFNQFTRAKQDAAKQKVLLLGDLPFLVSKDSADVWSRQHYFKLNLASGAPPDLYFADGQVWGMPPYSWETISAAGYDYLVEKLRYAQNFYDLYRIDHFVGIFRVWTFPLDVPEPERKQRGAFDPADMNLWEEHGRRIVQVMADNSSMLPCAEDLGTVPECSYKVLNEFAICGMDVQRWAKDWGKTYDFKAGESYRRNSIVTVSTHDMSAFGVWWEHESGSIDENYAKKKLEGHGMSYDALKGSLFDGPASALGRLRWKADLTNIDQLCWILGQPKENLADLIDMFLGSFEEKEKYCRSIGWKGPVPDQCSGKLVKLALENANQTGSIFSIQLIQDVLHASGAINGVDTEYRINRPGIVSEKNWCLRLPVSLQKMMTLAENKVFKKQHQKSDRI